MHDVGHVLTKEEILSRPSPRSSEEEQIYQQHVESGYRVARALPQLRPIAETILAHHEHWDGSGYPRGLAGEDIPLLARIMAVVDAFDDLRQGRTPLGPLSAEEALAELAKHAGTKFEPKLVEVFREIMQETRNKKTPGPPQRYFSLLFPLDNKGIPYSFPICYLGYIPAYHIFPSCLKPHRRACPKKVTWLNTPPVFHHIQPSKHLVFPGRYALEHKGAALWADGGLGHWFDGCSSPVPTITVIPSTSFTAQWAFTRPQPYSGLNRSGPRGVLVRCSTSKTRLGESLRQA